jgi:UDP-3-O-[3-hydroxymyristoyl] glucosamine N-acyltransferase
MNLADLAKTLGAVLDGDPATKITEVTGVAGIETAGPGEITFVANSKYAAFARTTRAAAVLVEPDFPALPGATLRIKNPYLAFARAIELFYTPPAYAPGIHSTAIVARTARVGRHAHIGAYAVVGEHATIGDNAVILPHVVIYGGAKIGSHFFAHAHAVVREHCELGDYVTLQNGVIIGADGFGFARMFGEQPATGDGHKSAGGDWYKIAQSGITALETGVEVQANATIDRASIGETRIKAGAKIDNLVQVGHGSTVGEDTLLCAQVGLAGSTVVGRNVILAGQVGVAGHCTIGDGAIATAQSGIPNDVAPGKIVSGYPAIDNRQWLRAVAIFNKLPDIIRELRRSKDS